MAVFIGSARKNELGSYATGNRGDQLQKASEDYSGEVSMQEFYVHKLGWYILRPKSVDIANKIAKLMIEACNNKNIGYSQNDRADIWNKGISTKEPTNCDCSSLVRECVIEAAGVKADNFNTFNEKEKLLKTGLFHDPMPYAKDSVLCTGDILVTKSKGHTAIVTKGNSRIVSVAEGGNAEFYPKYTGNSKSIYDALLAVGEQDASFYHRRQIAKINGFPDGNYIGEPQQNNELLRRLKGGELRRV